MLLTITMTRDPATDLGYLLHKHPARCQSFTLSFGQAHVFYPEARPERCTAALLLDVDPVGLVRNRQKPAQLEVMSRFAANPKWLIYLPPTMSPCETSQEPEWLEHPAEAFAYYRHQGVARVICEEKHMGSRAVVITPAGLLRTK